jgi:hypothetical protein
VADVLRVDVKIPADIAPGDYLLRAEVIALHVAGSVGGAQHYVSCYQLKITGGGTAKPSGVAFPGAYSVSLSSPGPLSRHLLESLGTKLRRDSRMILVFYSTSTEAIRRTSSRVRRCTQAAVVRVPLHLLLRRHRSRRRRRSAPRRHRRRQHPVEERCRSIPSVAVSDGLDPALVSLAQRVPRPMTIFRSVCRSSVRAGVLWKRVVDNGRSLEYIESIESLY